MRHDPPRIAWSGILWRDVRPAADLQRKEARMPDCAVREAEIATPAAYRAMAAGYRACAAELERALFAEDAPMPTLPALPGDVATITYAEGDRLCIDVVVDHVVVQTVTLTLGELREYRRLRAERAGLVAASVTPPEAGLFDEEED